MQKFPGESTNIVSLFVGFLDKDVQYPGELLIKQFILLDEKTVLVCSLLPLYLYLNTKFNILTKLHTEQCIQNQSKLWQNNRIHLTELRRHIIYIELWIY